LCPANEEALKIIYKYVQKDKVHEYKGRMGASRTLQQIKARFQNQAFIARNQIQRCLDMSLEAPFNNPPSFNLVKMNIEVNIAVWEASTGTAYGGHDLIIGNQLAQAQFKTVKKSFQGPQAIQSRLLTTFGSIDQLYLQGYPMGTSEVFDHMLGVFYDLTTPTPSSMAFYGTRLNSMGTNPAHYQNFRATSRRNAHFPGYAQFMARTYNGPCVKHFARLHTNDPVDQALTPGELLSTVTDMGMMATAVNIAREATIQLGNLTLDKTWTAA
jgi:hypothetical protein